MSQKSETAVRATPVTVGPPLIVLALAFAAVLASVVLLGVEGTTSHAVGYVVGSVIPLLLIGFFRRADLARRRNPRYVASRFVRPGLVIVTIAALVLAGLHVWPIATDLAS